MGFSPKGRVGEKSFPVFLTGRVKLLIFFGLMNRIYWNVSFECLLRLMLSELHGSVVWYFVINYGKFSPVITLNISSSFSFWYSSYISVVSCSCPIVLGYCVLVLRVAFVSCICFFSMLFPSTFQLGESLWACLQAHQFPWLCPVSLLRHTIFLLQYFWLLAFYVFWEFSSRCRFLICSCTLSFFFFSFRDP